jgi:two-component system, NtrC family, response regulator AtoC
LALHDPDAPTSKEVLDSLPGTLHLVAVWEGGNARFLLGPHAKVAVGRGVQCEFRIDHTSISRTHARLTGGETPTIEDTDSSNGIVLSGVRLTPRIPMRLSPGDVLLLGSVTIRVAGNRDTANERPQVTAPADAEQEGLLARIARSSLPVIILGETGTGKTRVGERIHALSPRRTSPMVKLNCAALPESLLESELFGYDRGAFTGATTAKPGLVEAANGGTLLLDEIGEMSMSTQAKILTVIETNSVQRLGSIQSRNVDVRYVAATHQDLDSLISRGQFRSDLFYRLNGFTVRLPPLRENQRTLERLLNEFLAAAASRTQSRSPHVSADVLASLSAYAWPGNVRELKAAAERAIVLSDGAPMEFLHFGLGATSTRSDANLDEDVRAFERRRIEAALDRNQGNQTRAAVDLGITRRALVGRLDELQIARPRKGRR